MSGAGAGGDGGFAARKLNGGELWVDKYKPTKRGDIIGNAVRALGRSHCIHEFVFRTHA